MCREASSSALPSGVLGRVPVQGGLSGARWYGGSVDRVGLSGVAGAVVHRGRAMSTVGSRAIA